MSVCLFVFVCAFVVSCCCDVVLSRCCVDVLCCCVVVLVRCYVVVPLCCGVVLVLLCYGAVLWRFVGVLLCSCYFDVSGWVCVFGCACVCVLVLECVCVYV